MSHISIRDLQKISGEAIGALPGPTPVKSGERTVGLLIPLKATDPDRLAAVLTRAERLAKRRDPAADDAALAEFGEVDPVDWSVSAVKALKAEALTAKSKA
ncbi:hypothetical protein ACVWZ4_006532 [Bradyrhizobium sp. USDA 4472]